MISIARKLLPGIVIALIVVTATFAAGSPLVVTATPAPISAMTAGTTQQFSATNSAGGTVRVFWSISGVGCAGSGCGRIAFSGLYSAPSNISSPILVSIAAISSTDWTSTGSDTITVNPTGSQGSGGTTVSITGPLQLAAGASQLYSATVLGPANTTVTWSVGGAGCGGNCGTITQGGFYTAPAPLSSTESVIITATSQATPSAAASVTVQLLPVIAVTIAQFNPQMTVGTSQQFTAAVTGTSIRTVKWSVSGVGCSGSSCGTISSAGLYVAPAKVSSTLNVTVKATASADPSKFATAAIAVGPIVTVSVSPSGVSLSVNVHQQYSVSVTGAANNVQWSITGCNDSYPACGMISAINANTALYLAPATVPSPATVNVTATLATDTSKTGSASVTVVPANNSRLNGQFAFLFKGFDSAGTYLAAGSFIADGSGNLTSGVEDINCGAGHLDPICVSGPVLAQTFTGSYTVNVDGRGTFTINPVSGPSYTFTLAVESSNAKARFIESDSATSGIRGSGVLEQQTPSAFATSALSARYAFSLAGLDSAGNPIAAIGAMSFLPPSPFNVNPMISAGVVDINDNGVLRCYPTDSTSNLSPCFSATQSNPLCLPSGTQNFCGTYNVSSNGRGTASFTIQGFDGNSADSSTFNFSLYVISSGEFFIISLDDPGLTANPVFSGQALQQQVPAGGAIQPGLAVFSWSGMAPTTAIPQAAIGQVSIFNDGMSMTSFDYDLNTGGTMTWLNGQGGCSTTNKKGKVVPNGSCTYAIQPNNDIVFSTTAPSNNQVLRIFPTATNTGFLLGPLPSVTVGKIEPQVLGSPSPFSFGSDLMSAANAPLLSGVGSLAYPVGPTAAISGSADQALTSGFTPDLPFSGIYSPTALPNGRAFMYLNSTNVLTVDFWVVTANKMLGLDVDPGAPPTLIVFEH